MSNSLSRKSPLPIFDIRSAIEILAVGQIS